ncbi:MAG: 3' terminal RNA ribose 2'-O-methyltransferase Hen1 [Anaerolineae bacterium]|nr:3' terminal RNA ribose 2'-O-methyltransferase Hen1 [Anaerolineae bacterium]
MLLTISTTYQPATDLGYLLHKKPGTVQHFDVPFGVAHVFYPEASPERCTVALLLDIDPISLIRDRRGPGSFALEQYVNDRPYVASSFLSVALSRVFGSALSGKSKERAELAATPIPLRATISVLPCRGGEAILRRLFEPLGYTVMAQRHPLDEQFPAWGESRYFSVALEATCRLADLLTHLYVLIPVLDDEKHYWVGEDEVEKLLHRGEGWLASHPARDLITRRYLRYNKRLTAQALTQLLDADQADPDSVAIAYTEEEAAVEQPISLNEQRIGTVVAALKASGAQRVLDLGCGEGQLIRELMKVPQFTAIAGLDVAHRMLAIASERLHLDQLPTMQRERIKLLHGSLIYRDKRLEGYDAAAVVEVIEHLDAPRLTAFERVLFEFARPRAVVITTPNVEYNVKFETLPAGKFRHRDHRFEWTRAEFQAWAQRVAERFGHTVRFLPIGNDDPVVGSPTQMAVFDHGERSKDG